MTAAVTVTRSPAPRATVPACERPDVSVVMVTFGTGSVVLDAIASIADHTDGLDVEVVVVGNPHPTLGLRTGAQLRLATSGVVLITPPGNTGFGGGCELGALHARADRLAFVNPDVVVSDGWLAPLIDVVHDAEVPTIACPVLLNADGSVQEAGQRLSAAARTAPITAPPAHGDVVEVDYASAACWLVDRDVHEAVGGFDPAYHPAYFEDVDLALRLRRLGGRTVVVGGSRIVHHRGLGAPGATTPANTQRDELRSRWPEITWRQPTTT